MINTQTTQVSATVFHKHKYIPNPTATPDDAIIAAAGNLITAIKGHMPHRLQEYPLSELTRLSTFFSDASATPKIEMPQLPPPEISPTQPPFDDQNQRGRCNCCKPSPTSVTACESANTGTKKRPQSAGGYPGGYIWLWATHAAKANQPNFIVPTNTHSARAQPCFPCNSSKGGAPREHSNVGATGNTRSASSKCGSA